MVLFYTSPKKNVSQKTIKLNVHAIDSFGQGVAHYQGKTIFVKNALPGEEVIVKLSDEKKQYAKAIVTKHCSVSPKRITAECHHYGVCGGCEMQHVPMDMQHAAKSEALVNLLKNETTYDLPITDVHVIASKPYGYRRRARLSIKLDKNQFVIGFRRAESNQIVDINMCPVLVDELQEILMPLKQILNRFNAKKALGHVELIHTDSGTIVVLRHISALSQQDIKQLTEFGLQHKLSIYLQGESFIHLIGSREHYYYVDKLKLDFSPLDFIQVNESVNIKMIAQAMDWLELKQQDNVLDLFCGMGNFSLPMATVCHTVIGVEGVPALVEKAKFNAILNKDTLYANTDFFVSNLDDITEKSAWSFFDINKVLLDPARSGAYHVMDKIAKYQPDAVVYISCNPSTLARDSKMLVQAGYRIAKASILDMFPQTKHVESMLLFTK